MSLNSFPVSAEALHGRTVLHGDTVIRQVTFLPFFDRQGRMKRVLTVALDDGKVGLLPSEVSLPRLSMFGRLRIPDHIPLFYPIRKSDLNELASLWHFDPWWLLDKDCYRGHWARLPLKATNCVTRTTHPLMSVLYRGDLSAAISICYKRPPAGFRVARWKPHFLPPQPPRTPSPQATKPPGWILDPIWTRTH